MGVWWFLAGLVGDCGVVLVWLAVVRCLFGWVYMLGLCPKPRFFLELVGRGSWLAVVGLLDWLAPTDH